MVRKLRNPKPRTDYPATIQALLAGEPIEQTDDARSDLLGIVYFGDWPELPQEARDRAEDIIRDWPDEP